MQRIKKYGSLVARNFGFYICAIIYYRIMYKLFPSTKFLDKKIYYIEKNISKKCEKVIKKYDLMKVNKTSNEKIPNTIWILWWQGLENAPELVNNCIKSIKKNNPEYDIIVITETNINNYLSIDEVILKKFNKGTIKFASLSDIIRVNLLSKYGGIWCDATIWCNKGIEKRIHEYDFFSIKLDKYCEDSIYVSKLRWAVYFLGTKKNNFLMNFLVDMSNEYFNNNDYVIDYFLTDYIIDIALKRYIDVKNMIERVPINNKNIEDLIGVLNETYNKNKYEEIVGDTYLFKLNYRVCLSNKKDTIYNRIINI